MKGETKEVFFKEQDKLFHELYTKQRLQNTGFVIERNLNAGTANERKQTSFMRQASYTEARHLYMILAVLMGAGILRDREVFCRAVFLRC